MANIGTLDFSVTLDDSKLQDKLTQIQQAINRLGVALNGSGNGLEIKATVSGMAEIESLKRTIIGLPSVKDIAVNLNTSGAVNFKPDIQVNITGFTIDPAVIQDITSSIVTGLSKASIPLKVDTSALEADIRNAVTNGISLQKGEITKKIAQAFAADKDSVKIRIDEAHIIQQVSAALAKASGTIGNLSVNATQIRAAVDAAFASPYTIGIRVDESDVKNKIEAALGSVNTAGFADSLKRAIDNSVKLGATSITDKLKAMFQRGAKLKVSLDKADLQSQINSVINSKSFKLSIPGVKVNKTEMIQSIRDALKGEVFLIKISVNKTDAIAQITAAMQAAAQAAGSATNGMNNFNRSTQNATHSMRPLSSQMTSVTQLATVLGNTIGDVFSTYQIKNFLEGIVKVGGELEKQKMAMGAILGDTAHAAELYKQISDLSMISPFDVQDLMKASKQLTAFGVKYNDLYETTRRLSDIAAGVGVDFGRIAYTYGHVSSETWLDARALRMFAYMGIPMLQKLSEYFSELNGVAVNTKQVRAMISNREVSFNDVNAVLNKMTNEGGEFYNMQQVMADSLAAKWRNLANDWNLMLGRMAESSYGSALKLLADVLMKVTENFEYVIPVIAAYGVKMAVASLAAKDLAIQEAKLAAASGAAAASVTKSGSALAGLGAIFKSLGTMLKTNAVLIAVTAVVEGIMYVSNYYDEIEKASEEAYNSAKEAYKNIDKVLGKYKNFDVASASAVELTNSLEELKETLKEYDPTWADAFASIFGKDEDGNYVNDLDEQVRLLKERLELTRASAEFMENHKDLGQQAAVSTGSLVFNDNVIKNASDYQESLDDLVKAMYGMSGSELNNDLKELYDALDHTPLASNREEWEKLREELDKTEGTANKIKKIFESGLPVDLGRISHTLSEQWKMLASSRHDMKTDLQDFATALQNNLANNGITKDDDRYEMLVDMYFKQVFDQSSLSTEQKEILKGDLHRLLNIDVVMKYDDSEKPIGAYGESIFDKLAEKYGLTSDPVTGQYMGDAKWIRGILGSSSSPADVQDALDKQLKKYEEILEKDKEKYEAVVRKYGEDRSKMDGASQTIYDEYTNAKRRADMLIDAGAKRKVKRGEDPFKKEMQDDIKMLREAYNEWKKWYDLLGDAKKAAKNVRDNAGLADLFGKNGFDKENFDPSELGKNLDYLRKKIEAMNANGKYNSLLLSIDKEKGLMNYDDIKNSVNKTVEQMNEYISQKSRQWDLFDKIFELTGDKEYAMKVAVQPNIIMGDFERELEDRLKDTMYNAGLDADEIDWTMDKETAKAFFGGENEMYTAYMELKSRIEKNGIEFQTNIADIIRDTQTISEQLAAVVNKHNRKREMLVKNGAGEDVLKAFDEKHLRDIASLLMESVKGNDNTVGALLIGEYEHSIIATGRALKNIGKLIDYINKPSKKKRDELLGIFSEDQLKLFEDGGSLEGFAEAYEKAAEQWKSLGTNGIGGLLGSIGSFVEYRRELKLLKKELSGLKVGTKEYEAVQAKMSETAKKATTSIVFGFVAVGSSISQCAEYMTQLADATNDASLRELANTLQSIGDIISSTAQGAASAGWVGAIIGFATSATSAIVKSVIEAKKYAYEAKQSLLDYQLEIKKLKYQINDDDYDTIFGTNAIARASEAYGKAKEALEAFNVAVNRRTLDNVMSLEYLMKRFEGYTNLQAITWKTGSSGWGPWKKNYYTTLMAAAPEIFKDGGFDAEAAQAFLNTNKQISDEQRRMIQEAIDLKNAYDEALKVVKELLQNWYGDWSGSLTDSIFDSIVNGTNAWDGFREAGSDAILAIGKQMMEENLFGAYFSQFENRLIDAVGTDDVGTMTSQLLAISGDMLAGLPAVFETAQQWGEDFINRAKEYGFEFGDSEGTGNLSNSIKNITEDQADILAAYINQMRGDLSLNRACVEGIYEGMLSIVNEDMPSLNATAEAQLAQLNMQTEYLRQIQESNAGIQSDVNALREDMHSVIVGTKSVHMA